MLRVIFQIRPFASALYAEQDSSSCISQTLSGYLQLSLRIMLRTHDNGLLRYMKVLQDCGTKCDIICNGATDWVVGRGANDSPGKLNVKTRPPLSLYFGFSIILFFSRLFFFFHFSEYFPVIYGFGTAIHIRIHHHSKLFSEFCLVDLIQWPVAPFVLSSPPGSNI